MTLAAKRLRAGYIYSQDGERGIYRNSLGSVLCAVCQHYVVQADDVHKSLSWQAYQEATGFRLIERMFWKDKTILAAFKCPVCGARYLVHCFGHCRELWQVPYNLSFFYSFSEQPDERDLAEVDQVRWLLDEPAPHLAGSREQREGTREAEEVSRRQADPQGPDVTPETPAVGSGGLQRLRAALQQGRLVAG